MRTDIQPIPELMQTGPFRKADTGLSFHHVGIACYDLDREQLGFASFGYIPEGPDFTDPAQGVSGRFLVGGGPRLELLRNDAEPGVLTPWLRKGIRFYHLAYETNDIIAQAAALAQSGGKQVVSPIPAVAFAGRLICFYMMPNRTLVELVSRT